MFDNLGQRQKRIAVVISVFMMVSISFLSGWVVSAGGASTWADQTTYIGPGSMIDDYAYIIFTDQSGAICAKNGVTGTIDYRGSEVFTVVQNALDNLNSSRGGQIKIAIIGDYDIDLTSYSGGTIYIGLLIPSFTYLDIQGSLSLVNSAHTVLGKQNYIFRAYNSTNITINGGVIDGNKAGQLATHEVYCVEIADCVDVTVQNMYIHDIKETGIAIEGTSYRCQVLSNRVINGDEDGIGNQFTCHDVTYKDNFVCLGPGLQQGCLYIEGGTNIVAVGNTLYGTAALRSSVGISITRGQPSPAMSVIIEGNIVYGCTYGITTRDYAENVSISGNKIYDNLAEGIVIQSTHSKDIIVQNNQIYDNDISNTGHSAILIVSCSGILFTGNRCYNTPLGGLQDYGIAFITGVNNCTISNNDLRGNQNGGFYSDGSAVNNIIRYNVGYMTENKGTANIVTSTTVTFVHGLAATPTLVLASFNSTAYGAYTWTATATQITITVLNSNSYVVKWFAEV